MWGRVARFSIQTFRNPATLHWGQRELSALLPIYQVTFPVCFTSLPLYRWFSTNNPVEPASKRNVSGFSLFLNDFVAQFALTSDRPRVVQTLKRRSMQCGFTHLEKAADAYLLDANVTNSINLLSLVLIASIQVKDDQLLSYILEDAEKYVELTPSSVFDILKHVCHYHHSDQFLSFLQRFYSVSTLLLF